MNNPRSPRATAAEAAAVDAVYRRMSALLEELHISREQVGHPDLLAVLDDLVDRQIELEGTLRVAIQTYCGPGHGAEEPY